MPQAESKGKRRPAVFRNGRFYFSRSQERRFFWCATMVMAALGLLYRLGVLHG